MFCLNFGYSETNLKLLLRVNDHDHVAKIKYIQVLKTPKGAHLFQLQI